MTRIIATIALLASACCLDPEYDNPLTEPPAGVERAMDLAFAHIGEPTGASQFMGPMWWYEGDCLSSHDRCVTGSYIVQPVVTSCWNEIHVLYRERVSATALVHELIHHYLHDQGLTGNDDHTSPWFFEEWVVYEILREEGL